MVGNSYSLDQPSWGRAIMKYGVADWVRRTLSARMDVGGTDALLQDFYIAEMGKMTDHVAAAFGDLFIAQNSTPLLNKIQAPTLILCGDGKAVSLKHSLTMKSEIPNADFRLFEGYSSAIDTIVPERCAREAVEFWERLDRSKQTHSLANSTA
jgi:pimeloyl-ACP methyl ester carboxylesterase